MAFNPLSTFHKNKRFWMAAILGVCMMSFVFCAGFKGDMATKLEALVSGRGSGPAIVTIDNRGVSDRDLSDLKTQRNLANAFMRGLPRISLTRDSPSSSSTSASVHPTRTPMPARKK